MNMTPKETVAYLDEYVIGQEDAKKKTLLLHCVHDTDVCN